MKINRALALSLAAASLGASAQSSVTLFGVVDANVRYVKNSGLSSNYGMSNSGLSSGRLGFRGVEDLGGGLKAGFWLESDVNADTGTISPTGKMFQRRSTVSLMGNWGEIRLGRDFSPASVHSFKYDPFGVIGIGGQNVTSRIPGAIASYYRHDNAVGYFTPNFGGLQAEFMFAPDEQATSNTGRHMSGRLSYDNGPVSVSLSYGTTNVAYNGTSTGKYKQLGLAGSYNFGVAQLIASMYRDDLPFGTYGTAGVTAGSEDRWLIGVNIPIGNDQIRASYVRTNARKGTAGYNDSDADKWAIGYVHNMSKRTSIYGTVSRVSNDGGANFAIAGGAPTPGGWSGNSTGAEVGIKHSF
ncbi:porin [Pseudorhodoferax aquiterrae]|uniref:Porin n=1 Tax=Pseudorhodoferax aquiterrae TaxID=747304 RepID=A0ABQ3G7A6_9BURK|nr:porin [Pseudorhodoferax aquiterrae]GHC92901.1 porin [Pseudorhodoferax aquiterrae]